MPRKAKPMIVFAIYGGKVVDMSYIDEPRERFKYAARRVVDNASAGWVVENGLIYTVSTSYRRARLAPDQAAAKQEAIESIATPPDGDCPIFLQVFAAAVSSMAG